MKEKSYQEWVDFLDEKKTSNRPSLAALAKLAKPSEFEVFKEIVQHVYIIFKNYQVKL